MTYAYQNDSPLSITASIAGILTFVVAILAACYVRITYLRNADSEYFQVKASLSWYKTESTWMQDLVSSSPSLANENENENGDRKGGMEHEMYTFVMDQLRKLEDRLLELLTEAEVAASKGADEDGRGGVWAIVPRGLRGRTDIAMSWLPVRAKAMELVRQRDALGSRVLFAQMSMINSTVRDQEFRARKREESERERMESLETAVHAQNEKLDKLEDLICRIMHRSQVDGNTQNPKHGNHQSPARQRLSLSELENLDSVHQESAELESPLASPGRKPSVAASFRRIPSI
ncbi:hypothetical protein LOCC1_G001363 [Lachnellula occidentalis]|uniref:Uncharacterized protein n=1 Tax=Lachnellula occidentalis TaxID=215460 RepID=A0A8H8S8F4_9HELO|nr:hypothetical protein LOCC1_G001363 [Lachnellula occidentalis]